MYKILPYTYTQAKKLGVQVFPASDGKHKLEIYDKRGLYICSVGAAGYMDFPNYLQKFGKQLANKRRALYRIRHAKDRLVIASPGWYADKLLW
jgi:hypothetical protein